MHTAGFCLGGVSCSNRDNVSPQCFQTWFTPLEAVTLKEEDGFSKLPSRVPGPFTTSTLRDSTICSSGQPLTRVLGEKNRLYYEVVVIQEDPGPEETKETKTHITCLLLTVSFTRHRYLSQRHCPSVVKSQLMENYTFDKFVDGDCNQLAYSVARQLLTCLVVPPITRFSCTEASDLENSPHTRHWKPYPELELGQESLLHFERAIHKRFCAGNPGEKSSKFLQILPKCGRPD